MGSPCLIPLEGQKNLVWFLLTRNGDGAGIDTRKDQIDQIRWEVKEHWGIPNEGPLKFVKGFFQVYLQDHICIFPFIFWKWVMYSWTTMELSKTILFERKLACVGPMILCRRGLILFTIIFVISLYIMLHKPIGLKFFLALLNQGTQKLVIRRFCLFQGAQWILRRPYGRS